MNAPESVQSVLRSVFIIIVDISEDDLVAEQKLIKVSQPKWRYGVVNVPQRHFLVRYATQKPVIIVGFGGAMNSTPGAEDGWVMIMTITKPI